MNRRVLLLGLCMMPAAHAAPLEMAVGLSAFQEQRWKDAVAAFIEVLKQDPRNEKARAYIQLAAREIQGRDHASTREKRLQLLTQTARRLEQNRIDPRPIETAILQTTQAEEQARQQQWQTSCEEAEVDMEAGRLFSAYHRVLTVLSENPSHELAHQMLSELQSRTHFLLEKGTDLTSGERYVLQGFKAYAEGNYAEAAAAWGKSSTLLRQAVAASEAARQINALHFEPYWKTAQARIDEARLMTETQHLFQKATRLYGEGLFLPALHAFRQVAIRNPDYPHLGFYLAKTEAAVEKDRARRLGEDRRKQIHRLFEAGQAALQEGQYRSAERWLRQVVALDDTHPQARSYLVWVHAELQRRHDPQLAQQHYEAGLIAYAGGRLEDAVREWKLAARMDPNHLKTARALAKVQKELTLGDEILP